VRSLHTPPWPEHGNRCPGFSDKQIALAVASTTFPF
jgi:hypothetical protein